MVRLWAAWWPGLLLAAVGGTGFAVLVDWVTEHEDLWRADQPLLESLAGARQPWLTTVLTLVTDLFGPIILPVLIAAAAVLWWRRTRSWRDPLVLVGAMVFSTALSFALKGIYGRPRPEASLMSIPGLETSYSFPSGHTIGASTLVLVSGYLIWRGSPTRRALAWWALAAVVIIGVVGGSRLYLGYHFLTDVLAGICVGVVVLGVTMCVVRWRDARPAPTPG